MGLSIPVPMSHEVVDDLRFWSDPSDKGFVTDLKEELYRFKKI